LSSKIAPIKEGNILALPLKGERIKVRPLFPGAAMEKVYDSFKIIYFGKK